MFNNQSYDDYIRSILGYAPNYDPYERGLNYANINANVNYPNEELEECYPDIYKVIYPMVQKACLNNNKPLSRELVDELTDGIYNNIEKNENLQININLQNQTGTTNRNTQDTQKLKVENKANEKQEDRGERRINPALNDIIRILILRELLGKPGGCLSGFCPGPRPPRPPMRPPYPGGIWPRPPYNRDLNDIYEY